MLRQPTRLAVVPLLCAVALLGPARADEGMWTLDNPPLAALKETYGFEPTKAWLDHVRLSAVRFNDGGSGSFVGRDGLVLTNHHVARGQLQKVSSPTKDYVADGFVAATRADELECPDLELNVLVGMEDVTRRVQGAVKKGMSEKQANDARKAAMARIEKESLDATGFRSDVVTLYAGGEYWLYRYRKYTDIRLVFAPEVQIAFYGGDPDNFTFPRWALDMALFRVYDQGKPIRSPAYLRWNRAGAADGDLVFVAGHPGSTDRLATMAQLEFRRDLGLPHHLAEMKRLLAVLDAYAARGSEEARQAAGMKFGVENGFKAITGELQGLKDPALMAKKAADEAAFRARVDGDPTWRAAYGDAWDKLAAAQEAMRTRFREYQFRRMHGYRLPGVALNLVRYVAEVAKPDGERLEEYHEAGLESLRFRLLSPAPVYPGLEEALLAHGLTRSRDELGADDPYVRAALGGREPAAVARELLAGTRLADPAVRKALLEGGAKAVAASTDPLIVFARRLDPVLREIRKWHEDTVEAAEVAGGETLGKARFAAYGKTVHPDATFTLRLAYGRVEGYPMNGTRAPSRTTYYGLFDRYESFGGKPPFHLPARYLEGRTRLDLAAPFNFVSTCDIIGGNSGSPVIDREGRLVGLIFDGNIESLVGRFIYDATANRAVAVHAGGMLEALETLYPAAGLVRELTGR